VIGPVSPQQRSSDDWARANAEEAIAIMAKAGMSRAKTVRVVRLLAGNGWYRMTAKAATELWDASPKP
jgi:hypothetical protein